MALAEYPKPDIAVMLGASGSQWSVLVEHLAQGDEAEAGRLELLDAETRFATTQPMLDDIAPLMSRAVGLPVTPRHDHARGRQPTIDRLGDEMHAGEHLEWKKSAFLLLRDVRNALAHGNPPKDRHSRQVLRDPDCLRSELEKACQRLLEKER